MLHALVLAAQALPVGYRSKNTRAEQAVALGLEGAVVDGFGLSDFTMRPAPDFFRRCQADADRIEIGNRVRHVKGARTIQGVPPLPASLTRPLTTPDFSSQFRFSDNRLELPAQSAAPGVHAAVAHLQNSGQALRLPVPRSAPRSAGN